MTYAAGDVDRPILPRSSNKPVQATALLGVSAGDIPLQPGATYYVNMRNANPGVTNWPALVEFYWPH